MRSCDRPPRRPPRASPGPWCSRRSSSIGACSRPRCRGAASTSRRARATRSTRSGVRHTQGLVLGGVAVAQVQPVELRRIRSGGGPATVQGWCGRDPIRRRMAPRAGIRTGVQPKPQPHQTHRSYLARDLTRKAHANPRQRHPAGVLAADQPVRIDHGVHPRPPRGGQLGAGDRGADRADPRDPRAADLQAAEVDAGDAAAGAADEGDKREVQGGQTAPAAGDHEVLPGEQNQPAGLLPAASLCSCRCSSRCSTCCGPT